MSSYVLPLHPMLYCVVSCTEHLFCKLRYDLVAVLFDEFLGERVHCLRGRFQLFHYDVRVGYGAAFLSLEAALHGAHIGVGVKSRLKSFVQLQLVGHAGVAQGMEYQIGQAGILKRVFADDLPPDCLMESAPEELNNLFDGAGRHILCFCMMVRGFTGAVF